MEVRAARALTMSNAPLKEEVTMFDTVTIAAGPAPASHMAVSAVCSRSLKI
jgi:hypothetical protein